MTLAEKPDRPKIFEIYVYGYTYIYGKGMPMGI